MASNKFPIGAKVVSTRGTGTVLSFLLTGEYLVNMDAGGDRVFREAELSLMQPYVAAVQSPSVGTITGGTVIPGQMASGPQGWTLPVFNGITAPVPPSQKFSDGSRVRVSVPGSPHHGSEGEVVYFSPSFSQYIVNLDRSGTSTFDECQLVAVNVTSDPAPFQIKLTVKVPDPPCVFCSSPSSGGECTHGALRSQQIPYYLCAKSECYLALGYHRERITAGLVDCEETRLATLKWVKGRKKP